MIEGTGGIERRQDGAVAGRDDRAGEAGEVVVIVLFGIVAGECDRVLAVVVRSVELVGLVWRQRGACVGVCGRGWARAHGRRPVPRCRPRAGRERDESTRRHASARVARVPCGGQFRRSFLFFGRGVCARVGHQSSVVSGPSAGRSPERVTAGLQRVAGGVALTVSVLGLVVRPPRRSASRCLLAPVGRCVWLPAAAVSAPAKRSASRSLRSGSA